MTAAALRNEPPRTLAAAGVGAEYDVHGWGVVVDADAPHLLAPAEELFGAFRASRAPHDRWRLVLRRGSWHDEAAAGAGRLVWSGTVPPGIAAANYADAGRRRLDLPDRGRCLMDLGRREAEITLAAGVDPRILGYFLMSLLCSGLARCGHVPLHAACLAARRDGQPCSVLIVAPSGTGKSTAAFGLASGGWRLMGDDLTLLKVVGQQTLAWGYPRQCHVRRPTLGLLPWLGSLPLAPTGSESTWQFPLAALGTRAVASPPPLLPAGLVVLLQRPNGNRHRCERVDPARALSEISRENVQPIEGPADADAGVAFATIGRLVRSTPAIRLSAGPDVEGLADFLAAETGVTPCTT